MIEEVFVCICLRDHVKAVECKIEKRRWCTTECYMSISRNFNVATVSMIL